MILDSYKLKTKRMSLIHWICWSEFLLKSQRINLHRIRILKAHLHEQAVLLPPTISILRWNNCYNNYLWLALTFRSVISLWNNYREHRAQMFARSSPYVLFPHFIAPCVVTRTASATPSSIEGFHLLCDALSKPTIGVSHHHQRTAFNDFQGPVSNQGRFASNSPRWNPWVHCTGMRIYRHNTSK